MTSKAEPESIFSGTADIVSRFFELGDGESLKQKSTTRKLAGGFRNQEDFRQLLFDIYETIEANWTSREPSKENWRIQRQTKLSPNNRSPEILLERAIAILGERGLLDDWYPIGHVPRGYDTVECVVTKISQIGFRSIPKPPYLPLQF